MYGKIKVEYEPSTVQYPECGPETKVQMQISSEADLRQMLDFFHRFLMASGYPLNFRDSLEVLRGE